MKSNIILEILKKLTEYEEHLNEAASTSTVHGTYKPPIRPGIRKWFKENLAPFIEPVSDYVDAEINYDSLDGDIKKSKKEISKREKSAKNIRDKDYKQDAPDEGDDEYAYAPFKLLKPNYKVDSVNEATSTGGVGSFRAPLRPGLKLWDKNTLEPFIKPLSGYDNAELYVDSLDGNIDTKGVKRKEEMAKKISKYDKKHPIQNDDDGSNLNDDTYTKSKIKNNISKPFVNEDLGVWFGTKKKPKGSKQPKGPWVNICRKKDGKHPPCGRPEGDEKGYPKCRAVGVAAKMSDSQKQAACQQKRKAEKKDTQTGKGQKPVMTSYKPKKKKTNESVLISLIRKSLS